MHQCQSCGMPLTADSPLFAHHADGSINPHYCSYCYKDGAFTQDITLEDMIKQSIPYVVQNNPSLTEAIAQNMMEKTLPYLARWCKQPAPDFAKLVQVSHVEPFVVHGMVHVGLYMHIGGVFENLWNWVEQHKLTVSCGIAIYHDDPFRVAPDQCRSDACVEGLQSLPKDMGSVREIHIAGGSYLCYRHIGDYSGLEGIYTQLCNWLNEQQQYCLSEEKSIFERYLNCPSNTAPQDLITDIYIPLID